jgi:hypothetical protein
MRFTFTTLGVFGAGFLAGYSFFRQDAPPLPMQSAPAPVTVAGLVDARTGGERIAAALALAKTDPLMAEAELWRAIQAVTADDVSSFPRDFETLAQMAEDVSSLGGTEGVAAIYALVDRWMEHEPDGALALMDSIVLSGSDSTLARVIMQICAQRDPAALLARAVGEKKSAARSNRVWAVFSHLAKNNPALGRELLETVPASLRGEADGAFESGRIEADPFYGLAAAAKRLPGNNDAILSQVIPSLSKMGAASVEQAIRQFPEFSAAVVGSMLSSLASQNATAAADLFLSLDPSRLDASAVHGIAWDLANRDPKAALAWLEKVPPEMLGDSREMVVRLDAMRDPRAALDWFTEHPSSNAKASEELMTVFDYFLKYDEPSARDWLAKQPREQTSKLEAKLLDVLNETGRDEEAARRITANPRVTWSPIARTGTLLARRDPAAAGAWALALADEEARSSAVTGVVREWLDRDPDAAVAWVSTFPAGAMRESAARDVAREIRLSHPAEAAAWVEEITEIKSRTETAQIAYDAWRKVDPHAARAWFSALPGILEYTRVEVLSR